MAFSATTTSYSSSICFPANGIRFRYVGFCNPLVSTQFKKPRALKIRSHLESNVSDMRVNAPKGLFPPEPEHYNGPKLKVVELLDHTHTSVNKGGEIGELDFRFIVGAPLHGINAFLRTNQLKTIDIARNALALALSSAVRALVDPVGAMRVIRNLAFGPGMDPFRPDQKTPVKNFFLDEDYIDSMEGATLSGRQTSSFVCYAVPKKRTSASKKRIRKNYWKKKAYWTAVKAVSLGKSISTGNSKSFFVRQTK